MRLAKIESLRKELEILSQSHEREVDMKDAIIQMLDRASRLNLACLALRNLQTKPEGHARAEARRRLSHNCLACCTCLLPARGTSTALALGR